MSLKDNTEVFIQKLRHLLEHGVNVLPAFGMRSPYETPGQHQAGQQAPSGAPEADGAEHAPPKARPRGGARKGAPRAKRPRMPTFGKVKGWRA